MKKLLVLVSLSLLAGFGCDIQQEVGSTDGGAQSTDGGSQSSQESGLICSASKACPNNQFCFNGICAFGCTSNENCNADQYCDTEGDRLCHNKTVTTCPETACAESQVCMNGFCSTPPPATQCEPRADGMDGCDKSSLCIEESEMDYACYSFPACPENRVCPTGTIGAVCNDGIVPNKNLICLSGMCRNESNCPTDWSCVKGNPADVVGYCSSGSFGSPCSSMDHCASGTSCVQPFPGFIGFCQ